MSADDMASISIRFGDSSILSLEESEEEILRKKKSPKRYWILEHRPKKEFVTESTYKGTWNVLGMHSSGNYNLFYGPLNDGYLFDNMFHGTGTLLYPNKGRMEGMWEKGHMISHRYFYPDDLCFGPYCEMPDRSFILERRFGLKPAGRSLKTNSFQPREIPPGCYDTVDGFYDPKKKYVFNYNNPNHIIRIPTKSEHLWILKHCRKAWTEPIGFRPDLYENWYTTKKVRKERRRDPKDKSKKTAKARFATDPVDSASMGINMTL